MTVAAVGNANTAALPGSGAGGNAAELFRGTNHSPSYFALNRATGGAGDIVDFCIPCNPYFPTPGMFEELGGRLRDILTYYPSSADTITAELASLLGLQPQTMAMGNGSTELITWIDHLLVRESLAVPIPTFGRWTDQPMETGKRVDMFLLPEANGFALDPTAFVNFVRQRGSRTAVICNPNNPDGGYLPHHAVVTMLDQLSDLDLVVVDESFLEFCDAEAWPSVVDEAIIRPNVVVLRSLGKAFGLHGVRFGYMVANPAIAGKVRSMLPKWNLNSFAEVIVFMLKQHRQEYAQSLRMLSRDRQEMTWQLAALPGMTVYPSQGNFVFVKLPDGVDGAQVRDRLLAEHSVLVRECGNKLGSSSRFMRLVVRSQPDVQRLLTGLSNVLYGSTWYAAQPGQQEQAAQWQAQQAQSQPQPQPSLPALPPAPAPVQEQRALYAAPEPAGYAQPQEQQAMQQMAQMQQQTPMQSVMEQTGGLYVPPPTSIQEAPSYAQQQTQAPAPQADMQQMAQMQQMQSQMPMQQQMQMQPPPGLYVPQTPPAAAQPAPAPQMQPMQQEMQQMAQMQPMQPMQQMQSQMPQMPQDMSNMYAPPTPPTPMDTSGLYATPAPQEAMYTAPAPQDMYSTQGGGGGGTAAYMQQTGPEPLPSFEQTAMYPQQTATAVQEAPAERTAVMAPIDVDVPPAFLPAQRRGPKPALYWQDSS